MKAVKLYGVGDLRFETADVPIPHGEELLLKVGACGICGSDFPRVFEHGSSNGKYPLIIGHEFSGEVVAVGELADPTLIGTKGAVFPLIPCRTCDPCITGNYAMCENYNYLGSRCNGGFAEYCLIPSAWHLIPSSTASLPALAMTEPACVAQHAVRNASITAGNFVVIFGAGPIGILAARWVQIFGGTPLLVDIAEEKVEFAKARHLDAVNSRMTYIPDEIRKRNAGRLADAAIEGSGAEGPFNSCVECVRPKGNIALLGNPSGPVTIPLKIHSMMLRKEVVMHGVWNSCRAPYPIDEWTNTVMMMENGRLAVVDLISDRIALEDLPQTMRDIRMGTKRIVKGMYIAEQQEL